LTIVRHDEACGRQADDRLFGQGGHREDAAGHGNAFGVQYVPTFVLVDSKGVKQDLIVGETSEDGLRAKLDALR
jgi:hypothetical protein